MLSIAFFSDIFVKKVENMSEELIEKFLKRSIEFNIFKVLKLEDFEIRHSNFLAWLLDPSENHELKGEFLKKFLEQTGYNLTETKHIKIKTEVITHSCTQEENNGKKIDILIEGKDFICIIENKFGSKEHTNQCEAYSDFANKFKKNKVILIFLDLNNEEYNNKKDYFKKCKYQLLTYDSVLKILREIENKTQKSVSDIIRQYIVVLEEKYGLYEGEEVEFLKLEKRKKVFKELETIIKNNRNFGNIVDLYPQLHQFYINFFPKGMCGKDGIYPKSVDRKKEIPMIYFYFDNTNPNEILFRLELRKAATDREEIFRRKIYDNLKEYRNETYKKNKFDAICLKLNQKNYIELLKGNTSESFDGFCKELDLYKIVQVIKDTLKDYLK